MNNVDHVIANYEKIMNVISNYYLRGLLENKGKIESSFQIFSDDESKFLYGQEITFCLLRNFLNEDKASTFSGLMSNKQFIELCNSAKHIQDKIICPDTKNAESILNYCKATTFILEQYRYKDIVSIDKGDVCLDIGSCLGDTAVWMTSKGAQKVYSFEIDNINIKCMKKTFKELNLESNIEIIGKAISSKNGFIYYTPKLNNIGGGKISNEKTDDSYQVEITTIDDFCSEKQIKPNFIKMDIEGAELDALYGARNTLQKYRPKLAICIYHKWVHRYEIPLFLKELLPTYNFYLKKSHPRCETVLFGKP